MILSDTEVDQHLDSVLRASGSGLKNYSFHSTLTSMRECIRSIERAALEKVKAADHIPDCGKMVIPYRYIVADKCFKTLGDAEHFQRSAQAMYRGKVEIVPVYIKQQ